MSPEKSVWDSGIPCGAVGVDQGGKDWLVIEYRGRKSPAVPYSPLSDQVVELDADALEYVGRDEPAGRALALRLRADESVRAAGAEAPAAPKGSVKSAMVLCAGLGTRLRPLTNQYPKPALPFFGGPLVRYSFALLAQAGIERVVINTHHLPEVMERTARAEAQRLGLALLISHEPVIQGTAGGIRDARRHLERGPFLLVNGDAFLSLDLLRLIGAHRASGARATLAVTAMPPGERFGAVEAIASGEVRRIGKPSESGLIAWHFLGVHVLEPEVFDFIPAQGEQDINDVVYPAMIGAGRAVRACPVRLGAWADMGTPARYLSACQDVMSGMCDLSALGSWAPISSSDAAKARTEGVKLRKHVDPTASIASGAGVERSQLGPGATIGAGASVIESAVLPNTRIAAGESVTRCIASGELRLPAT